MRSAGPSICGARAARLVWPGLALLLLLASNLVSFDDGHATLHTDFFRIEIKQGHLYGSLVDVLNRAAPVLLTALGMTLVIATGGIDLSVGAVVAIAGTLAAVLITGAAPLSLPAAAALAIGAGALAGLWNGTLVAVLGVQPIVATLILMVAGRGVAQLLSAGQIITVEQAGFTAIAGGHFLMLPLPISIVTAAYVVVAILARGTSLRLFVEATGDGETAARYAGVPVPAVKLVAYGLSGLLAGVAGLLIASNIKAADANNAGLYLELDAILAVVIGGTALSGGRFFLSGTVLGALLIQALTTSILTRGVAVEWTLVVKALVVVGICLLQSPAVRARLWERRSAA